MKTFFFTILALTLSQDAVFAGGFEFVTLQYPGARHTFAHAIDKGIIVGAYSNSVSTYPYHGFIFDGQSFSTLDFPGSRSTVLTDVDGGRIVGYYDTDQRHGFVYDHGVFTTLDHPLTNPLSFNGSEVSGISGDKVVGVYIDGDVQTHGYSFDGVTFQTIDHPLGAITTALGIDGSNIVGTYGTGGRMYGYIYDGMNFTTVDHPLSGRSTLTLDISGNTAVGYYVDAANAVHGYTFDSLNYTTLDVPASLGRRTIAHGIQGQIIVGQYQNNSGDYRGFVFVPEPDARVGLILSVLSAMAIPRRAFRRAQALARRPSHWPAGRPVVHSLS